MYTQPPLLQVTLEPYFFPMRSVECLITPYLVWVLPPCCTFTGNMDSCPKKTIAVSPSFIVSPYSIKLITIMLSPAGYLQLKKKGNTFQNLSLLLLMLAYHSCFFFTTIRSRLSSPSPTPIKHHSIIPSNDLKATWCSFITGAKQAVFAQCRSRRSLWKPMNTYIHCYSTRKSG